MKRFYELSVEERRIQLMDEGLCDDSTLRALAGEVQPETAWLNCMSENVIGAWRLPLGILRSLKVNGIEHCIPMATEEPSVVAAVNRVSRVFNAAGGVSVVCDAPSTTAQVMFSMSQEAAQNAARHIVDCRDQLLELANAQDPGLTDAGGGAYDLRVTTRRPDFEDLCPDAHMVVVEIDVHTADAMGANCVNTMAEVMMRQFEAMFADAPGFERGMAIVSNDGKGRRVCGSIEIPCEVLEKFTHLDADIFGKRMTLATAFATRWPERAVTHNKGILNGIEAAALPFGQDTRAIHAAAWYKAFESYERGPLATWQWSENNRTLKGQIEMPLVVGFIGKFRRHPAVNAAFQMAKIDSYSTLCGVLAAVGLAQNFGALWALVTEGIQQGHMKLHDRKS